MAALRAVALDKEISVDLLVDSIEQALLVAYHHTPGAAPQARVALDRTTGHVTVWALEEAPAPVAASPKPAARKPKTRKGRASVPSWDEILFGATKSDD